MEKAKLNVRNYMAIIAVQLVLLMTVLDVTLVNVALPVLSSEFGVSNSDTVWVITIYQLIITMLLLPLSSVGDKFSYRKVYLTGIAIFTLSSVLCALSGNFPMIIVSRALQGLGAACVMSVNIALVRLIYPKEILGRGLGLNAMVIAIGTAAGPTIAGLILSFTTWHWLFLINLPLGILAFIIGYRLLPHNPRTNPNKRFDWTSAIQNMLFLGLMFYGLNNFARKGDIHITVLLLILGAVTGFFYIRRQIKEPEPLMPIDLFKIKLYTLSICTSVSSFIAQNLVSIALPFLFLSVYKFSEISTGLLMTPWPLATMIISPFAARYAEKYNPGAIAATGMGVFIIGVVCLLLTPVSSVSEWDIVWRVMLCGVGYGLFQTPNNIVMVMSTPIRRTGAAGGMQSTARLVGQTLGATLVTIIFSVTDLLANSVRICLFCALAFATLAGVFSLSRIRGITAKSSVNP